ncbi:MAG: EAL domain-containing protein, partial [Limnobacter sp.]|nr:EAL domain-containing protein [Limnobacter sp.]
PHTANKGQDLVVWTIFDDPKFSLIPSIASIVAAMVLVVALSMLSSQALTRSMTRYLQQISKGIVKISEGDYQYRITASKLSEIDSVIQAFNAMGQVMQERDRFFRQTAFVDSLSGLDNRAFLLLTLRNRIQDAAEPLCILTWSVSNLSEIHDALGQEIVDNLLRKIAKKARRVSPAYLSLARLEGNVFAIVIPANLFNALPSPTFKRLMQCKINVGPHCFDIQGHAGLALYPTHGQDADTLLRRSEVARQLAKKKNNHLVYFEPRMEKKSADRLALIAELRKAIAEEEFELFMQPKLNLKSGRVTQAEALIRWNHPTLGLVAPGAFIYLAEQTGLIKNISKWALTKCYDLACKMQGHEMGISVNVSAQDLDDNLLLEHAKLLHKEHPQATKLITMEVTESCTINDPEKACELLSQFAKLGFRISVDDFGSGYSSLAYLKRFPVSELKIDRALIQNADRDTDSSIIVQSTIEMGHTMGLLVTAEGVETEGEFLLTSNLGADFIQGYYLSPAVPESVFFARFISAGQDQVTQPV